MSGYPGAERERRVAYDELHRIVAGVFAGCGMSAADAGLLAETLAVADLRGVHSHGTLRVPDYVDKLTGQGVDPRGRPRVVRDSGAVLVVDGANAMGQIAASFAMRQTLERARRHGLAAAAIGGSNHCGAMAYYAMMALPQDMIGLATTNALPTMAPWQGSDKILGINPLGLAFPAGEEGPVVLDFAFSASSIGKIRVLQQKGFELPEGWAFDADGRPTTDPATAIRGLLAPIGGYKGSALALAMGMLSSLLSGAAFGTELGSLAEGPQAGRDGHFVLALDVAAFEDVARFKARVDAVVRQIHACRPAHGFDRVLVPGELELETERSYRRDGIPLNDATLAGIRGCAARFGVAAAALGG